MADVIHADLELFLTGWLREALAARPEPVCAGVKVDNKEPLPTAQWPARLVVIRYDGSTQTSVVTDEASVGVTVFAGTQSLPKEANDLARIVRALIGGCAGRERDNPVADVETTGPVAVADSGVRARRYFTASMKVVGSVL